MSSVRPAASPSVHRRGAEGRQADAVIATKVGMKIGPGADDEGPVTAISGAGGTVMTRLGIERIDLHLFASPLIRPFHWRELWRRCRTLIDAAKSGIGAFELLRWSTRRNCWRLRRGWSGRPVASSRRTAF